MRNHVSGRAVGAGEGREGRKQKPERFQGEIQGPISPPHPTPRAPAWVPAQRGGLWGWVWRRVRASEGRGACLHLHTVALAAAPSKQPTTCSHHSFKGICAQHTVGLQGRPVLRTTQFPLHGPGSFLRERARKGSDLATGLARLHLEGVDVPAHPPSQGSP